ncbi:MAG: hypothetical protein WAO29_01850 [Candidatus Nanopelagicales bacterium]
MNRTLLQISGQGESRFYGHLNILAEYAGLKDQPWVNGYVQHGWTGTDGWGDYVGSRRIGHKFVWSNRVEKEIRSTGGRNVTVIGAPWLYLLKLKKILVGNAVKKAGVIAYPLHSQPWAPKQDTNIEYAEYLKETYGSVTVCLHWTDFENQKLKYESFGHKVITYGVGTPWLKGFDLKILNKQLETLQNHSKFVSNAFQTSVFYALSLGLEVEFGGPAGWVKQIDHRGTYGRLGQSHWQKLALDEKLRDGFWKDELGLVNLKEPAELRTLLGWNQKAPSMTAQFMIHRLKDLLLDGNPFEKLSYFSRGRS